MQCINCSWFPTDPRNDYVVELFLNEDIRNFTQSDLVSVPHCITFSISTAMYCKTYLSSMNVDQLLWCRTS